jgi:hypothetical protein
MCLANNSNSKLSRFLYELFGRYFPLDVIQGEVILTGPTPGPDGEESEIEVIVF